LTTSHKINIISHSIITPTTQSILITAQKEASDLIPFYF